MAGQSMDSSNTPMKQLPTASKRACRTIVTILLDRVPGRFSRELGLDLASGRRRDVFLWFLAAILFGTRISGNIVVRTFREFVRRDVISPARIVQTGWDGLVDVLDAGGYARYDFKTATKLLEVMDNLIRRYRGDLYVVHEMATDARDLEARLKALGKGIGDTTVNIFLRELRGMWEKADPPLSPLAALAAAHVGLLDSPSERNGAALEALKTCWKHVGGTVQTFPDFESALVRVGRDYCRRHRQSRCPLLEVCRDRPVPSWQNA